MRTSRRVRPRHRGRVAWCAAVLLALLAGTARAQKPPPAPTKPTFTRPNLEPPARPKLDQQVQNNRPAFLVRTWVDKPNRVYAEGEPLVLKARCEEDAFLYVLYQQADGKIFQIYPNRGQPENRVKARQEVTVPDLDDGFRWVVGPPFGTEVVKVIASKQPVDALALPGLKEERFIPVTIDQVAGAGKQLENGPAHVWTEHDLRITTVPRGQSVEPPGGTKGRRVGVFFGVADYGFNEQYKAFQRRAGVKEDKVQSLSLKLSANDARSVNAVLKDRGGFDTTRVFVNAEATRERLRETVTEWLPSVTKPGDTVVLFYSGHGSQIRDDDGDERDGQDETLDTHDEMSLPVFDELNRALDKKELPPALENRVMRLKPGVLAALRRGMQSAAAEGKSQKEAEQRAFEEGNAYLMRSTGVSDDEMGHWVQKLDGRRVVVILDCCHSGGQAPGGKSQPQRPAASKKGFDFLTGEFARLKDLDRPTLTVLAGSSEEETTLERRRDANGVFTTALLRALGRPAPVDVKAAAAGAGEGLAAMIEGFNKEKLTLNSLLPPEKQYAMTPAFTPQFFTTDPQPPVLIPSPDAPRAPKEP